MDSFTPCLYTLGARSARTRVITHFPPCLPSSITRLTRRFRIPTVVTAYGRSVGRSVGGGGHLFLVDVFPADDIVFSAPGDGGGGGGGGGGGYLNGHRPAGTRRWAGGVVMHPGERDRQTGAGARARGILGFVRVVVAPFEL